MKKLFLVFAKLLGLLQLYWALIGLMQMGFMVAMIARDETTLLGAVLLSTLGLLLYSIVSFGMAWLLMAKTEWLADKVGLRDEAPIEDLDRHPALPAGIILIGIFATVQSLPAFIRALFEFQQFRPDLPWRMALSHLIPAALQLALGLFLMLKSGTVVGLLARKPHASATVPMP